MSESVERSSRYTLDSEETAVVVLSGLYKRYGYKHFKMSKFEEYDLYARNKEFISGSLEHGGVITFTDTNGQLMALKPDVTLSIVKGAPDNPAEPEKVYYNESVYRVDKGTHRFKEITQVGLECVGNIDTYSLCEVVLLAAKSLEAVSSSNILDISHMGFISGLLADTQLSDKHKKDIVDCVHEKNSTAIGDLCSHYGLDEKTTGALCVITELYGPFNAKIAALKEISANEQTDKAIRELEDVYAFLESSGYGARVNLDFSIVNDISYYNGIVFHGFIDGCPRCVLSGGRYDGLVHRFRKDSGAVGFAVYLDLLSLMFDTSAYDADVLLLYDSSTDTKDIAEAVKNITSKGMSVRVQTADTGAIKYRRLMKMTGGEAISLESND